MLTVRFAVMLMAEENDTVQFAPYCTVPPLATAVDSVDSEQEEMLVTDPVKRGEDPPTSGTVASEAEKATRRAHHPTTVRVGKVRRQARLGPCKPSAPTAAGRASLKRDSRNAPRCGLQTGLQDRQVSIDLFPNLCLHERCGQAEESLRLTSSVNPHHGPIASVA